MGYFHHVLSAGTDVDVQIPIKNDFINIRIIKFNFFLIPFALHTAKGIFYGKYDRIRFERFLSVM